jgi:phosphatidate cytidylyltransferase
LAPPKSSSLQRRVVSALVILPICVAAVWYGGWAYAALLAVISAAMCWEWAGICGAHDNAIQGTMIIAAIAAPLGLQIYGFPAVAGAVAVGSAVVLVLALAKRASNRWILLAGLPYVVFGIVSSGWLRGDDQTGLWTVLWLVAVVVATDIGAYFTGRAIGGPKLAPSISPNKTWSGLLGGMACAGAAGWVMGNAVADGATLLLVGVSVLLAVVAQFGDLIESKLKRHFDVKDASQLIPGHGGFLDRFDGYLTVMPAAALITVSVGESPITWQ